MSVTEVDSLDLRETLARIDRAQAETAKFAAEQQKLAAEAAKFNRERWLAPLVALNAVIAAVVGALASYALRH